MTSPSFEVGSKYMNSLVNANFTNMTFQRIPIPHLTRTMFQKFIPRNKSSVNQGLLYVCIFMGDLNKSKETKPMTIEALKWAPKRTVTVTIR